MTSEQAILISVNRRKMTGIKYFVHEEKLKHMSNQTSSSNNEIKNAKVKVKEGTGSEMLIDKDTLILNKNETKIGNCTENNEVKLKEQQTSQFEKNTVKKINEQQTSEIEKSAAMPPPGRKAHKRKRKKRALKSNACFEPLTCTENYLSDRISCKNSKLCKVSSFSHSPDSIGSLTQSIYQYKNYETNNTKDKTDQIIPFSLTDDPSSVSLEGVSNNLPLPLISRSNSKNFSLGDKSSTILSNSSTENKNNKTISISSSCNSNVNDVLNVESNVSVRKPCETTVELSESRKSSEREKYLSLNVKKTLPMKLKKYSCSQPVSVENLISEAKGGKLKTDAFHISLPMPHNIPDTSEEENSDTNYLKSSPSLLENYCTAHEFTFQDDLPTKPCSKPPSLSYGIINGKKKLNFMGIQNSESKYKMNRRDDLRNTNSRPASEYTSSQKIIPEESESCYVTLQSFYDMNKTTSTKSFATPMKSSEIVLDSDSDFNAMLNKSKETNMNIQQEALLQNNVAMGDTVGKTFDSVYSSTQQSSSQSLNSSYREEYLNEESKICLGRVIKIVARHYKVQVAECVCILKDNSFNILNTMQELQFNRYANSESSN